MLDQIMDNKLQTTRGVYAKIHILQISLYLTPNLLYRNLINKAKTKTSNSNEIALLRTVIGIPTTKIIPK